ncbi:fasciclin [Siphonobacter sp. BAB-5385]|uniref:fasciclin domain-containing protein n=1 Tax=Siphonobacter sp. BAB-5385 TaxID=1864822 RepID=UPI000B9EC36F|nr:fasciclin domain-containing protein [Siphonobacter sp. BAB-5385]OZI05166.1 fasciclin [Siphonobacter sp. BAB-5385]
MKKICFALLTLWATGCVSSQGPSRTSTPSQPTSPAAPASGGRVNIAQHAARSQEHSILTKALKETGFVNTLQNSGPFTVFAPTDSAFHKSPEATALLQPDQMNRLRKVLAYHIVTGVWQTKNFQEALDRGIQRVELRTLAGEYIYVSKNGDQWLVTDKTGHEAKLETTDYAVSNGIVHVTDAVLWP